MRRSLVALAVAIALPLRLAAQASWRPEDRTILGDFTRITAVAASFTVVYVASDDAVVTWDPLAQRWGLPVPADAPGGLTGIVGALVDPLDQSLWLARSSGWLHYEPALRLWSSGTSVYPVGQIAFDQTDPGAGLFLRTVRGWQLVPRGAMLSQPSRGPRQPILSATVGDALRDNPSLDASRALILTAPGLAPARYTCAARTPDGTGWYLGTSGVGLLYASAGAGLPERRPFGLPGDQVGALYAAPGGVWALTERGLTSTAGLTFVASDLSRFDWRLGDPVFGQPFRSVRQLTAGDTLLWAATDGGALGFPIAGGSAYRLTVQDGLPDDRVFAVVANKGRVFFGTWSGLGELADSAGRFVVHRIAPVFADQALALAAAGDTLWVGTRNGLYARIPTESDLLQAPGWGSSVRFRTPVVALGWRGDTLVALTSDDLLWRDPRTGGWVEGPALSGAIGPLRVMANDADGLWVGGTRGVGFVRPGGPLLRPLLSGSALPGSVADVAVDQDFLWVATDRGLVRFALDAVRP